MANVDPTAHGVTTADHKVADSHLEDAGSIEKGETPFPNLAGLVQGAAQEHSFTPLQAIRTYWRAFGWSMFMSIGALLWGYDAQVGGGILSVPSFRRDFGSEIDGQYVLSVCPYICIKYGQTLLRHRMCRLHGRVASTLPALSAACSVVFRSVSLLTGLGTFVSPLECLHAQSGCRI